MIKGGIGGGNTITGAAFEVKVDFLNILNKGDYKTKEVAKNYSEVFYKDKKVALLFKKEGLYHFLKEKNIDWEKCISSQLKPDNSLFVLANNTFHIIEVKYQQVGGSVDEKLQTCDFKIKQYKKLLQDLNCEVNYLYLLCDWFKSDKYEDARNYIKSIPGCDYFIEDLPLKILGLPE